MSQELSLYPLIHPEKIYTTLGTAIILHCISDDIRFSYLLFTARLLKAHHAPLILNENITPATILIILLYFEWFLDITYNVVYKPQESILYFLFLHQPIR